MYSEENVKKFMGEHFDRMLDYFDNNNYAYYEERVVGLKNLDFFKRNIFCRDSLVKVLSLKTSKVFSWKGSEIRSQAFKRNFVREATEKWKCDENVKKAVEAHILKHCSQKFNL
jgi:hypothetical protein